jgi:hypothetical protein
LARVPSRWVLFFSKRIHSVSVCVNSLRDILCMSSERNRVCPCRFVSASTLAFNIGSARGRPECLSGPRIFAAIAMCAIGQGVVLCSSMCSADSTSFVGCVAIIKSREARFLWYIGNQWSSVHLDFASVIFWRVSVTRALSKMLAFSTTFQMFGENSMST